MPRMTVLQPRPQKVQPWAEHVSFYKQIPAVYHNRPVSFCKEILRITEEILQNVRFLQKKTRSCSMPQCSCAGAKRIPYLMETTLSKSSVTAFAGGGVIREISTIAALARMKAGSSS